MDEIFQEAWVVAWRRLDELDSTRPFGLWLRGVVRRLVLAAGAKEGERLRFVSGDALAAVEEELHRFESLPGEELGERLEHLRVCVRILPERMRTALVLR